MGTFTREDVLSWRGRDLVDNDGDKIGSIEDIYLDRETDEPEWAVVTTGLFGTKRTFVPISDAQPHDDGVRVPFEKATVKDAPRIDPDGELSHDEERTLYQHYGRDYADSERGSGLLDRDTRDDREPRDADGTRGDALDGPDISEEEHEVTLRSEEPVIEKRTVPKERVRLEKDVETDQREVSDTVRSERIDVDDQRS